MSAQRAIRTAIVVLLVLGGGVLFFRSAPTHATVGTITEFALPHPGSQPDTIVAGADGALWFTEVGGNAIGRVTITGTVSEYAIPTAGSQPYGLTAGPDGALWPSEADGNKIGRLTTSGALSE